MHRDNVVNSGSVDTQQRVKQRRFVCIKRGGDIESVAVINAGSETVRHAVC